MTACINQILEEFRNPLKNFIKRRVPNDQDSEDILQDVFLKVFQNIYSLSNKSKIHAWVYTLTRNATAEFYRKKGKNVELVELYDDLQDEIKEELNFNEEIASCLKTMIKQLPEIYREALILTEFQGLTQTELSEKMGLSISGAKSRVQRAKQKLKYMIIECCTLEFDRLGNIINYTHKTKDCKYC